MRLLKYLVAILILTLAIAMPARAADDAELRQMIGELGTAKGYSALEDVITKLAATGDGRLATMLNELGEGNLFVDGATSQVVIAKGRGNTLRTTDPLTGDAIGEADKSALDKIRVNNRLRRSIRDAISTLTLRSPDPVVRLAAAQTMINNPSADALEQLDAALAEETDKAVTAALTQARASAVLVSDLPEDAKLDAIAAVAAIGTLDARALLQRFAATADGELKAKAEAAIVSIDETLALWSIGQNVFYGLSLGSVLLLAAIGLAITFGVMGVINMAHGEMVMIGAYVTFVVQEIMRTHAPGMLDWSLTIALPLAFLTAGAVGLAMERGIIRFLYGRPLETLLATWGVSLILQQAVRTIFGPNNREVSNPSWMSGAFDLGQMTITNNRLIIVVFALVVFAVLWLVLNRSPFGLQTRAVTQNRRMASAMGIRAPWIDALTFALGSGIAGIAGVALSQIDNVSPNLGQSYIIDSFMVVVFGGVGNIWGTLVGAFSLGIVNKFLEPFAGAVLGKILVLVFIILFIQKRPRGLFALKGRAIES